MPNCYCGSVDAKLSFADMISLCVCRFANGAFCVGKNLIVSMTKNGCKYKYTIPSHQKHTTYTLPTGCRDRIRNIFTSRAAVPSRQNQSEHVYLCRLSTHIRSIGNVGEVGAGKASLMRLTTVHCLRTSYVFPKSLLWILFTTRWIVCPSPRDLAHSFRWVVCCLRISAPPFNSSRSL